ncbi:MAG TPA: hypothetical protein VK254_01680 [Candidatus Bathyarchaeia archaeon]|nr:hypothetical protein [Candidatus Bathyarchaeia archaeon]
MTQNIQKIFKSLKDIEPSRGLEGKILKAIARENSLAIRKKLMYARAGLTASFGVLAYTLFVFGRAFLESDFWNMIKLAFSDGGVVAKNWSDFSFSLLETLPVLEIFAILVPVVAVLAMFSWYFKFTNNNYHKRLT